MSRTTVPNIYAAGDCTGVLPLASVAAMQGRIAVSHAMGDAVTPAQAAPGGLQHLHLARRSPRWAVSEATSRPASPRATSTSCRCAATPAPRCAGHQGRLRQDLRPQGIRHRHRRRDRGAEGLRADLPDRPRREAEACTSTTSPTVTVYPSLRRPAPRRPALGVGLIPRPPGVLHPSGVRVQDAQGRGSPGSASRYGP